MPPQLAIPVSIHAPRVGGDDKHPRESLKHAVSIHAPRVGGDLVLYKVGVGVIVSIHAPRVGGDTTLDCKTPAETLFQSTPPAWGAT